METPLGTKEQWYNGAVDYWNKQEASIEGVLGGFGCVHAVDMDTSKNLLTIFKDKISGFNSAIEMGAGIGRVSKDLLCKNFKEVDLLEPAKVQIDQAKINVPEVKNFYEIGLENFEFERKYDCIWLQWCLCYLTDDDLLKFMIKAKDNLEEVDGRKGIIYVKENIQPNIQLIDKQDNSVMRTDR